MDRKNSSEYTRTYARDSGIVSPSSSTSSVASENAGRLVLDTFNVTAHNVNELVQLVAMWEAEGRAKSEAEGESLGALYVNQKVENYLNKFFNRRKVFAEHFIGDDVSAQDDAGNDDGASIEYLEEQLRKYRENKESLMPGSGFFSPVPREQTALTSVVSENDGTDAASGTTDPLSEIVEKDDFYSFRSTESYPTSEDYQEIDSTSQTIIATSSMSSRGSSQQAVHTDVPSAPSTPSLSTPEPTAEPRYLTPLQASLLAIKTAYFVETVSTTQSRSFLSVEDTSSLASCESAEEPYLDVESEDIDSNLSMLVEKDVMSLNVIQEVDKDKPQAASFHKDDDVSFKRPQALCSAAVEEYVSPFSSTQESSRLEESLRTSIGPSEERIVSIASDNIDLNLPVQGTTSYTSPEDRIVEYQFPVVPKSQESVDVFSPPLSRSTSLINVQSEVVHDIPISKKSPDSTPQTMTFATPVPSRDLSQQAESPALAPLPSVSSTQEAAGHQSPLTALQMSLFAVKVASSIEAKSSNQDRSFLSTEDESPIFLPGPTEKLELEAKDSHVPDISTTQTQDQDRQDLTTELERFRKQFGLVPKDDSSDLMTEEVLSDLLAVGVSSDLVVEEGSSSLMTEADSSSFVAEVISPELLAEEDSSSQRIRAAVSGLVVQDGSYSQVAREDLRLMQPEDEFSGLVAKAVSSGMVPDDDTFVLLTDEDSYGLVAANDFFGLVADNNAYGLAAEANTYRPVARDDTYGLIAEEGASGAVAVQDSYGVLTRTDSYRLLAEDELYAVVRGESAVVQETEDESYELLTGEDSSDLLLQENLYGVRAEVLSPLLANVDVSCLIAKGLLPSPLVGETSNRVALSFSSSDFAKPAERIEIASSSKGKSIETDIVMMQESSKQNMVPVLRRVIKVMESFYAAAEAPYFAGYTVKIRKNDA